MGIAGYAGSILYVDLTSGDIKKEPLDVEMVRTYIGGAGINNKLAYDLIPPDVEPLSPRNTIIIGTGPFNGTIIPGCSQVMIIYKSPLNNSFPHSNGGGCFSQYLKSSGYDHLVITGCSDRPVYLKVHDEDVAICDAGDLWGKDVFETTDELRRRHEPCSVIPIGQAGENLVSISVTQIDKGGTVGSGGLCAVMGSKKLKAIVAVRGTKGITIADPKRLQRLVDEVLVRIRSYHLRDEMMRGGAMTMTSGWVPEGVLMRASSVFLPYPPDIKELQAQIYELHKQSRKKIACVTCPMSDKDRLDVAEHGIVTYDTAVFAVGAIMTASPALGHCAQGSPSERYVAALRFFDMVNRYGIDRVYSFEGLFDFAVTLYEDGVITKADTNGLELNREYDTLLKLTEAVALRKGFGDILADGVVGAARRIGRQAQKYVQNVIKGQFVIFDPRVSRLGPMQFEMMVYPGRALGVAAAMGAPSYSPGWPMKELLKQAERCGVPQEAKGRIFGGDSFNVGRLSKHGEDFFNLFNMFGQCHRLYISRFYSFKMLAELYSAVTGIETTPSDLKQASERVWNLWKLLNCKAGFDRKDDEPPEVWFKPLKGVDKEYHLKDYFGTSILTKQDVGQLLDDYYDERGWDRKTSLPTTKKLEELGLSVDV
ncbi:MAG TPA: hypothetical protein EYP71_01055 [Dehalococcoidia bacterium]|nr:hypothetical protein [Dehalococcoidia bacterium]